MFAIEKNHGELHYANLHSSTLSLKFWISFFSVFVFKFFSRMLNSWTLVCHCSNLFNRNYLNGKNMYFLRLAYAKFQYEKYLGHLAPVFISFRTMYLVSKIHNLNRNSIYWDNILNLIFQQWARSKKKTHFNRALIRISK